MFNKYHYTFQKQILRYTVLNLLIILKIFFSFGDRNLKERYKIAYVIKEKE